jgi:uncharacterized repeat protein (TIGR03803 family)
VLYNFAGIPDGRQPSAALINIRGTLYGTTLLGGAAAYPSGTMFSINPTTGAETVLHSFSGGSGGSDGGEPGAMINVGGILYGTTSIGGPTNSGTVFTVNPATGAETILYTFDANNGGGYEPSSLINVRGTLYGTVGVGGGTGCGGDGCGAVFRLDPTTGAESLVHAFGGGSDGAIPGGALIILHGTLYGTTGQGGGTECGLQVGCGTVFSLDPSTGAEAVLYAFAGGSDGQSPDSVVNLHGTLYGVTGNGGGTGCGIGCGTVFSLDPSTGAEAVLYAFTGGNDGSNPSGRLITKHGVLYGETYTGASNYGTVFKFTP